MNRDVMRRRALAFCFLAATTLAGGAGHGQQATQAGAASTPSNPAASTAGNLRFLAVGHDGTPTPALQADEVSLRVNNQARKIVSLAAANDEPRTIGFFFDVSGSRQFDKLVSDEVESAAQFLEGIWHEGDLGFVVTFSLQVSALLKPTHDLNEIRDALRTIPKAKYHGPSGVYDALCAVHFGPHDDGHSKIFIVVSDFDDNISDKTPNQMIQTMQDEGIRVFVLLSQDNRARSLAQAGGEERIPRDVAKKTGGEVFLIDKKQDVGTAFHRLAGELGGAYKLTYEASPGEAAPKKLQLTTTRNGVELLFARE
jgi:hypothetical protein